MRGLIYKIGFTGVIIAAIATTSCNERNPNAETSEAIDTNLVDTRRYNNDTGNFLRDTTLNNGGENRMYEGQ